MTTYYFSDNQSGAHASAVPGNNANAGTSPSLPKRTPAGFNFDALAAGDQVLFAQGGSWDGFNVSTTNPNVTASNPLVFGTYAPPSGATGVPILRRTSGGGAIFQFGGFGGGSASHGGYTLQDLYLQGGPGVDGVLAVDNVRNITIERLEITQCDHGIYGTDLTTGQSNTNMVVRDSYIHHNFAMGLLGGADGFLSERNTWSKNGSRTSGAGSEHNVYINGAGRTRAHFRNDSFIDPGCAASDGTSNQGNLTFHGEFDQIIVEDCLVSISSWVSGGGGISLTAGYSAGYNEVFRRAVLRDNRLVNCQLEISNAPYVVADNNTIVWTQAGVLVPLVSISARGFDALDVPDIGGKFHNNSCYVASAGNGLVVFNTNNNGGGGATMEVTNNLIVIAANAGTSYGFSHQALGQYTAHRNNLVYGATNWSSAYATLAAAQAAGFDASSLNVDPLLVAAPSSANGWAMRLQAGSPALGAGNATYRARLAFKGWLRPSNPSIGAFDANNP